MAIIAVLILIPSFCHAQTAPGATSPGAQWAEEMKKNPELLAEFGRLVAKLVQEVHFPEARVESRLLPLLPESTTTYAAFSNYGEAAGKTLKILRGELQESQALRDWWHHGEVAKVGPQLEKFLEKFAQLHEYLGEEIVVGGSLDAQDPKLLVVAALRKPGLKKFLQEQIAENGGEVKAGVRLLDLQDVVGVKNVVAAKGLLVLVRDDYVVAGTDLATLRGFNARVASHGGTFPATPFGQRIAKEYASGVTLLAAADLHKILEQTPAAAKENATFQQSGFADVKYLVWDHKKAGDQSISQTELSFNSPRRGPAAWLANTRPLKSLDFVSPEAMMAITLVLANPAKIFEDVKGMAGASPSNPFAATEAFEKMLALSVKDDLLGTLGGEVTAELDNVTMPKPAWKVIFGVRDAARLEKTLTTLLAAGKIKPEILEDSGVSYFTVQIPTSTPPLEISYAFVDGNLILGSSQQTVAESVRLHKSGESLAKSKKFLAALPPGHALEASALVYQNPIAMAALQARQIMPDVAQAIEMAGKAGAPVVAGVYGEESAIREASSSPAYDLGAVLIVAAVAIPNLLRSKIAANEASAVGSLRSVNTAQVTYASTYPERGYASHLAVLGIDSQNPKGESAEHAGLLDRSLANEGCSGEGWCTKSGYRFRVVATCKLKNCGEYVSIATPVDSSTGTRTFCSTSELVIRYQPGAPLEAPISVSECQAWMPLQ